MKATTAYLLLCLCTLAPVRLASAEIVYTDVEPDIRQGCGFFDRSHFARLDLDANGTVEVVFRLTCSYSFSFPEAVDLYATFPDPSEGVVDENGVAKLDAGEEIGPLSTFEGPDSSKMFLNFIDLPFPDSGNWLYAEDGFVGLRFDIDGDRHFGWVRLSTGVQSNTIHDYAYESQANTTIAAGAIPEPSSQLLGLLGMLGLLLRGRPSSTAATRGGRGRTRPRCRSQLWPSYCWAA